MKTANQKLKIGIVCYPSVGGSGIVATQLGQELAHLGHQVHFISYEEPFMLDETLSNVFFHKVELNAYSLFKYPDYTIPLAVKMVEVSGKHKLDILHVHYAVPHATAALLAKNIANMQKIKFPEVVTTLHGTDITLLGRDKNLMPAIKYSIDASCGVTAVSESLKQDTIKLLNGEKEITVIHNFYNPKKVTKSPTAIRKSLGINVKDFLVIHLSNLRPFKRIPDLLQIFAKANKKNKNIKLLILAGGDFKPYESLVKKLRIGSQVVIKRDVEDIQNYINASDIGLHTSDEESFGMAILETMACGKPVLATAAGGIPEFMQNGKTGYLFPIGKIDAFVSKLVELATDPQLVAELGQNAKERASFGFSGKKIVEEYLKYYRAILTTCGKI